MNLSEHTIQLVHALYRRSGFLERLRGNDHKVSVLREIGMTGELGAVSHVAPFLAQTGSLATAAARTIGQLLQDARAEDILALDEAVRLASEWGLPVRWKEITRKDLSHLSIEGSYFVPAMGVLSCHPNGYVREEAITRLAQIHDGSETPFLFIRLNDWVPQVRKAAKKAVMERIASGRLLGFSENLALVFRLTDCRRDDHADVVVAVISELVKSDGQIAIEHALTSSSRVVRRQAYRLSMLAEGRHRPHVIHLGFMSDDVVLRLWSARDGRRELSDDQLERSLALMEQNRFAPVRREALVAVMERFADRACHALTEALLDRSVSIRDFARFYLRKLEGEQDFAGFYQKAIELGRNTSIAISGLGETGSPQDINLLQTFLLSPASSVRKSAVRSMGLLADDSATKTFLNMVEDRSSKVAFEACRALKPRVRSVTSDEVMKVFRVETRCRILRALVDVLDLMGSWAALPLLLEAATNPDHEVANLARQRILSRINRVFVRPSSSEKANIIESLNQQGLQLPTDFVRVFTNWMNSLQ